MKSFTTKKVCKVLVCLLALLMVASVFAACGNEETSGKKEKEKDNPQADPTGDEGDDEPGEDTVSELPNDLDFGGENFTLLVRSDRAGAVEEFYVDPEIEKPTFIQQAIHQRNLAVETQVGVTIATTQCKESEVITRMRDQLMSGDGGFDVACPASYNGATLVLEGGLYDWYELPYVNFDKVWWGSRAGFVDAMELNGSIYMATGDASELAVGKYLAMYVNNELLEDYTEMKPDDLYKIVKDGKWTIDKLYEISAELYNDKDGDGDPSQGDFFGCNFYLATIADNYVAAFDIPIVSKNADGDRYISLNDNGRAQTGLDKLKRLCYSGNACYMTSDKSTSKQFFASRHALFTHGGFEWAAESEFTNMTDDYGIIPYPMLDEDQKGYKTTLSDVYTCFTVPSNIDELSAKKIGAAMECLASTSYNVTTVAYYQTILKKQCSRDEASMQMLDLIHDSAVYEFGFLFSQALGYPNQCYRNTLKSKSTANWASYWGTNGATFTTKLNELLETAKV